VRASDDNICKAIQSLVDGDETWADIMKRLPIFESQEVD
jgi:glycyl-tRNA synthetase